MSKILYPTPILEHLKNTIDRVFIVDTAPADYAAAVAAARATATLAPGDFTVAPGDVSGKKLTFGGKNGVAVTASGNYNHAVFAASTTTTIYVITDGTTKALNSGDTANVGAADILEIRDAVAA